MEWFLCQHVTQTGAPLSGLNRTRSAGRGPLQSSHTQQLRQSERSKTPGDRRRDGPLVPAARSDDHAAAGDLAHLLGTGLAHVVVQEGLHGERGGPGRGVSVAHVWMETNSGRVRRSGDAAGMRTVCRRGSSSFRRSSRRASCPCWRCGPRGAPYGRTCVWAPDVSSQDLNFLRLVSTIDEIRQLILH